MNKDLPYFDRVLADCLEAMIMDGRSIPSLLHQCPEYRDELSELLTVAKVAHKLPGLELEPILQPEPQVQIEHEPTAP